MATSRLATSGVVLFLAIGSVVQSSIRQEAPVPDKLVVLTFDDSAKSHATYVAPLLKKLGFGATFFITEGFDFPTNKTGYMTWEEIAGLHKMGFEIGNHTGKHANAARQTREAFTADLELIERRCLEHGIPKPVSFAYPGNGIGGVVIDVLKERGYRFARRGGAPEFPYEGGQGVAFDPKKHGPLSIPSAGDARPVWKLDDFVRAVSQAKDGKIAVLQFHGVPDREHPWVSTEPELFENYVSYLKDHEYNVMALRDVAKYLGTRFIPAERSGPELQPSDRAVNDGMSSKISHERSRQRSVRRADWVSIRRDCLRRESPEQRHVSPGGHVPRPLGENIHMAGRFTGFSREAIEFLKNLEKHNNREWFQAHKDIYERACRQPMKALLSELEPQYGPSKISRINRDMRFARDRSPYKTYIAAGIGGSYISLSRDGLYVGGGMYKPDPAALGRFRAAIHDDASGSALAKRVTSLRRKGYRVDTHETLTSTPKGYALDHPWAHAHDEGLENVLQSEHDRPASAVGCREVHELRRVRKISLLGVVARAVVPPVQQIEHLHPELHL